MNRFRCVWAASESGTERAFSSQVTDHSCGGCPQPPAAGSTRPLDLCVEVWPGIPGGTGQAEIVLLKLPRHAISKHKYHGKKCHVAQFPGVQADISRPGLINSVSAEDEEK